MSVAPERLDAGAAELDALNGSAPQHATTDASGRGEVLAAVALDRERLDELTEAWIPVVVGERRGVLVFTNCD
ncbi:DUF6210 family protein [Actinoplanes sp. NPDC089786]|uniref:DUF6210 family protein n=1 Tax=Actinoplanes sp. NPDC089786 TaxID=3155185 RepID=UPI0034310E08